MESKVFSHRCLWFDALLGALEPGFAALTSGTAPNSQLPSPRVPNYGSKKIFAIVCTPNGWRQEDRI